ncbi:MAG: phytoene desaturase family protein [Promethearchaeota archaeon]
MLVSKLCSEKSLPLKYREKIKKRLPSYSAVNLYLGLNCDLKQHNINDYGIWVPNFRNNSPENLNKSLETADYSNFPIGSILIYSNIDPTCCPPNKSIISVYSIAILEPFEKALDAQGKKGNNYQALKTKIANQLINQISIILKFPELKSHIEVMELATPITFRRYSYNRGGALMGWELTPEQLLLNQLPQKTPIKNLFLCGQWTNLGGGISNVMKSGDLVAQMVKKYLE